MKPYCDKNILFHIITMLTSQYYILLNEQNYIVFIQGYYKLPLEQINWIFKKYLILQNFWKTEKKNVIIIILKKKKKSRAHPHNLHYPDPITGKMMQYFWKNEIRMFLKGAE